MKQAKEQLRALSSEEYNEQWTRLDDFIRYNPGARHRRRLVLQQLKHIPFKRLLDVGCGNGQLLRTIRDHLPKGPIFEGADLSPLAVEKNSLCYPEMKFHVLNLQESYLKEKFDVVVCSEVIEHIENQPRAFGHLAKMVIPGGYLLVTFPTGTLYDTEKRFGHVHHPRYEELAGFAAHVNMEIVTTVTWGWPFYSIVKWATNINPDWANDTFAAGQYGLFHKWKSNALYWLNFRTLQSPLRCQIVCLLRKPA